MGQKKCPEGQFKTLHPMWNYIKSLCREVLKHRTTCNEFELESRYNLIRIVPETVILSSFKPSFRRSLSVYIEFKAKSMAYTGTSNVFELRKKK